MISPPPRLQALARRYVAEEATGHLRHALRNKLAAVRNANFFLKRKVDATSLPREDARVAQFFDMIDAEVRAACDLIEKTRTAEPPLDATAPIDGARVARELVAALAVPAGVAVEVAAGEAPVVAEPDELALALHCLIENAVEAVEPAGRVVVSFHADGARTAIEVTDDGAGLAAEAAARAFEPFFTTRPGRQGLGLNIARRVASRWGGALELAAAGERGARAVLAFRSGRSDA